MLTRARMECNLKMFQLGEVFHLAQKLLRTSADCEKFNSLVLASFKKKRRISREK